jgi:predicted HD superfamily hydrolase involved in NAD metabolism
MSSDIDSTALEQWVRSHLSEKRFIHSLGVAHTCILLSKKYNERFDDDILYSCGLLHDIARQWTVNDLQRYAKEHRLTLYDEEMEYPVLLHAPVGASVLSEKGFDEQLCLAVRYHSLGSIHMGRLGLILYLADYLEPGRTHLNEEMRKELFSYSTLEALCLEVLSLEIAYLAEQGATLSSSARTLQEYLYKGGRL